MKIKSITRNGVEEPITGLGDVMEKTFHPIAKAIHWPCLDKETGNLKPTSPCAKMRDGLNKLVPAKNSSL